MLNKDVPSYWYWIKYSFKRNPVTYLMGAAGVALVFIVLFFPA